MTATKIQIDTLKLDLNLSFYYYLKHLVKAKLTTNQASELLCCIKENPNFEDVFESYRESLSKSKSKQEEFDNLVRAIDGKTIDVFRFALKLYLLKDLLLAEAKIGYYSKRENLSNYDQLSLSYDRQSLLIPYSMRVNGALLSLIFFETLENKPNNLISMAAEEYIKSLSNEAKSLKIKGIEPNQIFMLIFTESINQSIISDAGSDYETRVKNALIKLGIANDQILKKHDKDDKSTEYDFFFELKGKTFGIGAKKTLRERYKQFIKTSLTTQIDVTIEITLGLDLNEAKAQTIRAHGTVLFVAEEVYSSREFLQKMDGVYSTKSFTLETFNQLAKNSSK